MEKLRLSGDSLDFSYCRLLAQDIAGKIFECLGLLNQTYYTRSWGHYREQIRNLPLKPDQLDKYLDTIMLSHSKVEITNACEKLTINTLNLILKHRAIQKTNRSYQAVMKGFYEEERGMLNKLLTACEKEHYETAFFVAIGVQDSLARILYAAEKGHWPAMFDLGEYREIYRSYGFPELSDLLNPKDLKPLQKAVQRLIDMFEEHIQTEGVRLNIFSSVAEFESFIKAEF